MDVVIKLDVVDLFAVLAVNLMVGLDVVGLMSGLDVVGLVVGLDIAGLGLGCHQLGGQLRS